MSVIRSKRRRPSSLGYNSWVSLPFSLQSAAGIVTPSAYYVTLPLNFKIMALTYCLDVVTPGTLFVNMISGTNVAGYEGTGAQSSYGYLNLGGTFVAGDVITVTVAGVSYSVTLNARTVKSLQVTANALTSGLNNNLAFSALYRANSCSSEVVIQTLSYSTATPTFAVSTTSAAGTVTASGANMVAGVAGALPTTPVADQTQLGIVPSGTAVANNALFPVDILIPAFASGGNQIGGVIYATENFDAIWPAGSIITAIGNQPGSGSFHGDFAVWGVPVDNHPMMPEEANTGFKVSPFIL